MAPAICSDPSSARRSNASADLCPGDFRTVRQSLWYLPGGADNARRLAALREESDQKERLGAASFDGPERRPVGF